MEHNAIKHELIEWLFKLEDTETLNYLKIVKDSNLVYTDWWHDLPESTKSGIKRGQDDLDNGRITSHEEIKLKYGL